MSLHVKLTPLKELQPASEWDSYKDLMSLIITLFEPKKVIEFGSGESTRYLAEAGIDKVYSVEHNKEWFNKIPDRENVIPTFRDTYVGYKEALYIDPPYDLVFIDGKERQWLLENASDVTDVVLLHDAHRGEYRKAISGYKYWFENDSKCSLILTNSLEVMNAVCGGYRNMREVIDRDNSVIRI